VTHVNSLVENADAREQKAGGLNIFAAHPKGLPTLFFTELWERFSYYGMRALLVLYMVAMPSQGGLGFSNATAGDIYGTYTMMVYMMSLPGGFVADRFLGQKLSIIIGGIIIACGHFTLAVPTMYTFYAGLTLIVIGTGFLKPNVSTKVGTLYKEDDHRRDSGFSIYYMGINVGASLAPLVCGFLAQSQEFKGLLSRMGLDPNSSWHWGFAAAGVGMTIGLITFIAQRHRLEGHGDAPKKEAASSQDSANQSGAEPGRSAQPMTTQEWKRIGALGILFVFWILFWAVYEQGGSSLNLFADKLTDCRFFGWEFPSTWLQTYQSLFVIALAPVFSWLWIKLGDKEPSSPAKFAFGLFFLALGISLMVPASILAQHGKVSAFWLIACYLLQVIGELCLSPVGLSTVTKLAPIRFASLTMGAWFLGNAIANKIAGDLGGQFNQNDTHTLIVLFGGMGIAVFLSALVLAVLVPSVRKLMSGVH
jgi:POT family proton-dependent oligopeptide transporter